MPVAVETITSESQLRSLQLKKQRTDAGSSAVSRLPKNAVASILLEAAFDEYEPDSFSSSSSSTYSDSSSVFESRSLTKSTILSLSHVNSLWRTISLSLPSLWLYLLESELDYGSVIESGGGGGAAHAAMKPLWKRKQWFRELFRRSDPLPINIGSLHHHHHAHQYTRRPLLNTTPVSRARDPELVGLELEYLDRIRTYRVFVDERGWETLSSCVVDQPAEVLETLSVAFKPTVLASATLPSPQLPKNIFCGHAPRLEKISLRGCLPCPEILAVGSRENLKALTVSQINAMGVAPTAERWLGYLSGMPQLEQLVLKEGAISTPRRQKRSKESQVSSPVELSSLRELTLEGSVEAVGAMLQRLEFPDFVSLSIVCSGVEQEGPAVDAVLKTFASRVEVASKMGMGSFLSVKGNEGMICISDGTPSLKLELHLSPSNQPSSAHPSSHSHTTMVPLWESILSSFLTLGSATFASLTQLELHLPSAPPALVKVLSEANKLERLVNLTATMAKRLLPPLQRELPSTSSSTSSSATPPSRCSSPGPEQNALLTQSDSTCSALSQPLPVLPNLHTLHFSSPEAFVGGGFVALRAYLKWRSVGWRAVRFVQVSTPPTMLRGHQFGAEGGGVGVPEEAVEALQKLRVGLGYVG
ncbi:hypothetical protein MD484_g5356, partial [Candolleomyces efflorescens]